MRVSAAKASCCLRRHASGSFGLGWCSPQMHRASHIPSFHWLPIASKQSERPCWTILKQPTARHCHSAVRYRLVPLMIPLLRLTCMKIQSADSSAPLRLYLEDFCNSASRSSMCILQVISCLKAFWLPGDRPGRKFHVQAAESILLHRHPTPAIPQPLFTPKHTLVYFQDFLWPSPSQPCMLRCADHRAFSAACGLSHRCFTRPSIS